jgi:hypothetical protein
MISITGADPISYLTLQGSIIPKSSTTLPHHLHVTALYITRRKVLALKIFMSLTMRSFYECTSCCAPFTSAAYRMIPLVWLYLYCYHLIQLLLPSYSVIVTILFSTSATCSIILTRQNLKNALICILDIVYPPLDLV